MSRQHEAIAEVLRTHTAGMNRDQYVALCVAMADALNRTNKRFNRDMFLFNCEAS